MAHAWLDPDPNESYTIFKDMVESVSSGRVEPEGSGRERRAAIGDICTIMMNPVRDQNVMHVQCKNHMTTYNINVSGNSDTETFGFLPARQSQSRPWQVYEREQKESYQT